MAKLLATGGLDVNLPTSGLLPRQFLLTTDRGNGYFATSPTATMTLTPAIDKLAVLPAVDAVADLVMIHDASESTGQREKKITVQQLKTAMNIPNGDTDEKVAVVAGGTAGYLWGTTGANGIIRTDSSITMTKDAGNAFMTLSVDIVDGGTF